MTREIEDRSLVDCGSSNKSQRQLTDEYLKTCNPTCKSDKTANQPEASTFSIKQGMIGPPLPPESDPCYFLAKQHLESVIAESEFKDRDYEKAYKRAKAIVKAWQDKCVDENAARFNSFPEQCLAARSRAKLGEDASPDFRFAIETVLSNMKRRAATGTKSELQDYAPQLYLEMAQNLMALNPKQKGSPKGQEEAQSALKAATEGIEFIDKFKRDGSSSKIQTELYRTRAEAKRALGDEKGAAKDLFKAKDLERELDMPRFQPKNLDR
jgi:hypothetical protein